MKLKVLLMTLVFAVSMVAQTATPSAAPKGDDKKAACTCPDCKSCCKDGQCAGGGKCCGDDKCARKTNGKTAKADCCAGHKDCCKEGKACCGDHAKTETANKEGKSCCGGKCDRKAHEAHAGE